jgi:FlaG/FlaF family flagellin (archaellin)
MLVVVVVVVIALVDILAGLVAQVVVEQVEHQQAKTVQTELLIQVVVVGEMLAAVLGLAVMVVQV